MAFSIGISAVIGGISSAINSGNVGEGIANGVADGIFWGGLFAFLTASVQAIKFAANAIKNAKSGIGFDTFDELKGYLQNQGIDLTDKQVHHIVEQNQILKSGFSPKQIHNTRNIVILDKGVHIKVSAYYSSKDLFTNGLRVRQWLVGKTFKMQYDFGIKQLINIGVKF